MTAPRGAFAVRTAMTRYRAGQGLVFSLLVVAAALGIAASATPQPPPPPPPPPPPGIPATARTVPSPFQFDVQEINLKFGDKVVLRDQFRRQAGLKPTEMGGRRLTPAEAPAYTVDLGKITAANVRNGTLRLNQAATSDIWVGPGGSVGHRLHHRDDYVAMLTLPVDVGGRTTFLGREAFPLEFTVVVRKPRFNGFEKLKIGLLETEGFKNVASIAVGRLPTPFPTFPGGGGGGGGGGGSKIINILDLVSDPAILLGRVEEPDIMGEIVLDHAPLEGAGRIDNLEMTLRVAADGLISGVARSTIGGQVKETKLAPKAQEPRDFFEKRERIAGFVRLAATVFVETLPRAAVFKVAPAEIPVADARGKVHFRIEGIGFGPDTRAEIVPEGASGQPIRAEALQLERQAGGPEGAILLADFGMRESRARSYALRITTGGFRTVVPRAVRVF
jgi:hypothetical protein